MDIMEKLLAVLRYSKNISLDQFATDLHGILDLDYIDPSYAEEKFASMRRDFACFFCNLDDDAQRRFVMTAFQHYGIGIADVETVLQMSGVTD